MDEGSWLLQLCLSRKAEPMGSLPHSPEVRIRPSLGSPISRVTPDAAWALVILLALKGKGKDQVHVGRDQASLRLCPLTSLAVLFSCIFKGLVVSSLALCRVLLRFPMGIPLSTGAHKGGTRTIPL